ncbi:hypothetical protein C8J56DRAFT_881998 [Mycena floridula]|nr:hypothetical protein C8J56DRAFT_881998 [Mycena floridula]
MSKTKNTKSHRRKSGTASRQSHRLNPTPDNPQNEQSSSSLAQSTPTLLSSNVAVTANSGVPRYLFAPVIGNPPRMTAPLSTLSSLDTLTPSPPVAVNRMHNENVSGGDSTPAREPAEHYPLNNWRARHEELMRMTISTPVGHTTNPIVVENSAEPPNAPSFIPVNVNPEQERRTITLHDSAPIPENETAFTEQARAHRRAQKMPHHGATELDDDDVVNDIEIQQAILDNTLPIIDHTPPATNANAPKENPSFSYLPAHTSMQLNDLFNQAVNILMSSVTNEANPILKTQDSIAAIAGNHFAANLEAAVSNLMLPRMQNESSEAYLFRMHAQRRFYEGLNPQITTVPEIPTCPSVHFSPSTAPENNMAPPMVDNRVSSAAVMTPVIPQMTGQTRSEPVTRPPGREQTRRIQSEPASVGRQTNFADRVAVQRMRNGDMRQSGSSNFVDQGISFDEGGNPYDRNNGGGNRSSTGPVRPNNYNREPRDPPLNELSETTESDTEDLRRRHRNSSDALNRQMIVVIVRIVSTTKDSDTTTDGCETRAHLHLAMEVEMTKTVLTQDPLGALITLNLNYHPTILKILTIAETIIGIDTHKDERILIGELVELKDADIEDTVSVMIDAHI